MFIFIFFVCTIVLVRVQFHEQFFGEESHSMLIVFVTRLTHRQSPIVTVPHLCTTFGVELQQEKKVM